jgi:hypothetical protein
MRCVCPGPNSPSGGAPKREDYPCIDLATLRRSHMLKPGAVGSITFRGSEKPDRLLVFAKADRAGLLFIKRRPDGELAKLFVRFTYTPAAFNGWRAWFCCPGCKKAMPLPLWCQYAALSQMPRACVRLTKREDLLARSSACGRHSAPPRRQGQ